MAFFTQDYLDFFRELTENNQREWFHANKKRYENAVKKPFNAFVQHMIDRVHAVDNRVIITPKDAIFRINRDIRFSADKTPYKTHMSAIVSAAGKKEKSVPNGMYFQFSGADARIYGGAYMLDKNQLQAVREGIASDLSGFEKLIKAKDFTEKFGSLQGDEHKRLPKEFKEVAEKQPLLFKKSFYYFATFPAEAILSDDLPDLLMEYYEAGRPVSEFFAQAMQG